ncbi:hypothetical protein K432DRAFT_406322 [Lepidopterella palustris CBS 459.81]|uniref:DH domain-containing protein n=1 Tax=Lepidopterella palustris CBS 459.81 TaxID=1314670 RepID=A0A8E2E732_9PEZI|nr:hypothetical protein K432DRAFT_406322 [Lepidopterella palustris CBS 459.81]
MDPLSVTAGVMSVIGDCLRTAKDLYDLRSRYSNASITITAIYSESMVISASLSQVQSLLLRDALQNKPELHAAFDTALTGCMVVFSCLDEEVRDLATKVEDRNDLNWKDKAKLLWKEDAMRELLVQLRGQQTALTLLIQGLQMESLSDIKRLLQENSGTLEQVATRSRSLRATHPKVTVPDSMFYTDNSTGSVSNAYSIIGQAEFEFDDVVVNSKAYRRAMAIAQARVADEIKTPEVFEGDLIDFNDPEDVVPKHALSETLEELQTLDLEATLKAPEDNLNDPDEEYHSALLNDLERDLLPFMPPIPSASTRNHQIPETVPQNVNSDKPFDSLLDTSRTVSEQPLSVPLPAALPAEKPPLPPRRSAPETFKPDARQPVFISTQDNTHLSSAIDDSSSVASSTALCPFSPRTVAESLTTINSVSEVVKRSSNPLDSVYRQNELRKRLSSNSRSSLDIFNSLATNPEDFSVISAEELTRDDLWREIIQSENDLIKRLSSFQEIFRDPVVTKWPILSKHIEALQTLEEIVEIHREHLLRPLESQLSQHPFAICNPEVLQAWAIKAQTTYRTYHQRLPHAQSAIRLTLSVDAKFRSFVATLGLSGVWYGKSWEDFLQIPTLQLDFYINKLESLATVVGTATNPSMQLREELLKNTLIILQRLRSSCTTLLEKSAAREEIQTLYRRIQTLNSSHLDQLNLSDENRKIIHQGRLAVRVKGKGPWLPVHGVLLDNHLFWGKIKAPKSIGRTRLGAGKFWVLEAPLPTRELLVSLPDKDHQFVKPTIIDEVPRKSVIYQFFVKTKSYSHTLGVYTLDERHVWINGLNGAIDAVTLKDSD